MHKLLLVAALTIITQLKAQSQISIDAGIESTALKPVVKVAYEKTIGEWFNAELATRYRIGESVVPSLSIGLIWPTNRGYFKVMGGGYYHIIQQVKDYPQQSGLKVGGSIRLEVNQGTVGLEYNGSFVSLTVGFVFRRTY